MTTGFLIFAILAAAIAYAVLTVRRARREHRARSDERAASLIAAMQARGVGRTESTAPGGASATVATAGIATPPAPAHAAAAPALAELKRARFLTEPQRLLYLVLRAALPDHIVMANTRMVDLLDLPAGAQALERDSRLREMLHQRLDCVVCRQDLVPVAALVVYAPGVPNPPDERSQAERLRELGIKFLRLRIDSLPRPAEMRALVLG